MLEVVFSKSAEGSLKVAQHCAGNRFESAAGVFYLSDNENPPSEKETEAVQKQVREEMSRDVFCFADDLSAGDISGDCLSENRISYITETCSLFSEERTCYLSDIKESKEKLDELVRRSASGETIRIWYSEQPCEYCGICWVISEVKKRMKKLPHICAVKLPSRVESENTIVNYMGWGGVCPEEFYKFLPLEKEVSPVFICAASSKWSELQAENSPLRAVINGTLQSVPEDFYDFFIRKEIDSMDAEFHEAVLIGSILGKYQLGIGDSWIALRIEKMIGNGSLVPVTQPEPGYMIYRRMLRKCT